MLLQFSHTHYSSVPFFSARKGKDAQSEFAIFTTRINGKHAPSADYFISLTKKFNPTILYPEDFDELGIKHDRRKGTLTIGGKAFKLNNLPFFQFYQ